MGKEAKLGISKGKIVEALGVKVKMIQIKVKNCLERKWERLETRNKVIHIKGVTEMMMMRERTGEENIPMSCTMCGLVVLARNV